MGISIALFLCGLSYNSAQATSMAEQTSSYSSENCYNETNMTSDYLSLRCANVLTNTTNVVSDLKCDSDAGWFNVCVWLEQDVNLNGTTPTRIMVSSSQDGGQSYGNTSEIITQVNSSELGIRNPNIGINQQFVYVSYEKDAGYGFYDPFLVISSDGGKHFGAPDNLSLELPPDSFTDSRNSTLNVDETGKYMVSWVEVGPDGSVIESDCGHC